MLKHAAPAVVLSAITQNSTLSDIVEGVLDVIAQLLNTRLVAASRIESPTYTIMAAVDQHHVVRPGQTHQVFDTFCLQMLESGQPLRIDDITQAPMSLRQAAQKLEIDIRSYVGVPLHIADGRVFGSLWAADSIARRFTSDDVALLQLFARLLTPELIQADQDRHCERIAQARAMHTDIDPATGLLAAEGFEMTVRREAARRNRYGSDYAVAALTLLPVEAELSQNPESPQASTLQKAIADILMRTSRLVDCCARINEHTFAVLFAETTTSGVLAWQKRIEATVDAWNRVHAVQGLTLRLGIGVADCDDEPPFATPHSAVLQLAKQRAITDMSERQHIADSVLMQH